MSKKVFNRIAIMGRQRVDGVVDTLIHLEKYLINQGASVFIESETAQWLEGSRSKAIPTENINDFADLIIVVGGDGSLLHAARLAAEQNVPVLGVNRGRLGFLTDINPDNLEEIGDIIRGDYLSEERFLLETALPDGTQQTSLNDVVINPGQAAQMISFEVHINDKFAYTLRADGLITATPTGSTAYALSGGGPILHPTLDAIVLVPLSPHTLSSRPIVVKGDSKITVKIHDHNQVSPELSCDGQTYSHIKPGTDVSIQKYNKKFTLIHHREYDYYDTLRRKLNWKG